MRNENTKEILKNVGEFPLFIIEDYARKHFIFSMLILYVVSVIYISSEQTHDIFSAKVFFPAIIGLVAIAMFGWKKSNRYFYGNMIKANRGGAFRISYDYINLSDINEIFIVKNARFFTPNIEDKTMSVGDKRLYASIFYTINFVDFIVSCMLKIFKIIKKIKPDTLVFITKDFHLSIYLSELSEIEFQNLNRYLQDKFGKNINSIDTFNFKGEKL